MATFFAYSAIFICAFGVVGALRATRGSALLGRRKSWMRVVDSVSPVVLAAFVRVDAAPLENRLVASYAAWTVAFILVALLTRIRSRKSGHQTRHDN